MKYMMHFPIGIYIDVCNPPKNFEEQIRSSFADYTMETSKEYTYCDKLSFIDLINENVHNRMDSISEVEKYIQERFSYELSEYGTFASEEDFQTCETLEDVYELGKLKLHDNYGNDHHIYDEAMKLIVRAIKVVINYEKWGDRQWLTKKN